MKKFIAGTLMLILVLILMEYLDTNKTNEMEDQVVDFSVGITFNSYGAATESLLELIAKGDYQPNDITNFKFKENREFSFTLKNQIEYQCTISNNSTSCAIDSPLEQKILKDLNLLFEYNSDKERLNEMNTILENALISKETIKKKFVEKNQIYILEIYFPTENTIKIITKNTIDMNR